LLYHKVTFDGPNRLILVNNGETNLDVLIDIYSDWKEWAEQLDNLKYTVAISTIGGESIGAGQFVGATFFLENGWRIRSWEGDHSLVVNGNLFTRESGEFPFIPAIGRYSINYIMARSQLIQAIEVPNTGSGAVVDTNAIAAAVWDYALSSSTATGTFGNQVGSKLLTFAQYLAAK